jgi:hypothetical protein
MPKGHRNIFFQGLFGIGLPLVALAVAAAAQASPNTVDVFMKAHMSRTARYPTAVFKMMVRNNSTNNFSTVGHMTVKEDGEDFIPLVLTFPLKFDGARPDLHWRMPLNAEQTQIIKFTTRVTAKKRYCLSVALDVTYVDAPKGGSAYAHKCLKVHR